MNLVVFDRSLDWSGDEGETRCVNNRGRYLNQPSRSDEHYFAIDQVREE